jgi:predicted metal-dependent HD superfamily phosphohydrolase
MAMPAALQSTEADTLGYVTAAADHELRIAWERHLGEPDLLESLLARHRESHRRYHGLSHLVWVVRHIHELMEHEPVDDIDAVVVAAFFHDAVYDPSSNDNEAASARLATRRLTELGWPTRRIEHITWMIRATADHTIADAEHDTDTAVLLDADLAILGSDPAAYQAYVNGVRAEYAHLDDHEWSSGRRAVLEQFLGRDAIFATPTAHDRWEARARANVTAELASLS